MRQNGTDDGKESDGKNGVAELTASKYKLKFPNI